MNKNDFRIRPDFVWHNHVSYKLERRHFYYEWNLFGFPFGRREKWIRISTILTKETAEKALQEIQEYYS
jgi:hypothetical protein